jgi:hypothetical protein
MPDDETMVYDTVCHQASALNRTATLVWRHCDGKTSVPEFVELLRKADLPADEAVVWLALDRLEKAHLLEKPLTKPADHLSRRRALRRLVMAGGLALLPAVTSIVAPTPSMAASGGGGFGK